DLALSFSHGGDLYSLQVFTPNDINDISKGSRRGLLTGNPLNAIAAGDFNGDGRREIAGVNITSNGGITLAIYTVDPSSLAITQATSLVLTAPSDASAANPVTHVSLAR